jgi:soluble lytic murein transglycosylase
MSAPEIYHGRTTPPHAYDLTFDIQDEQAKAEAWLRTNFSVPAETDLSNLGELAFEAELQRGLELWRLGLYDEARAEFEQLRLNYQSDAVQSYRIARFLSQIGAYRSAVMAARQVLDLALMDDAQTLSAPLYFNHLRFPVYYNDLVMPLAQEYGFHPLFLYSVIRQESLFEGFVRSRLAARVDDYSSYRPCPKPGLAG